MWVGQAPAFLSLFPFFIRSGPGPNGHKMKFSTTSISVCLLGMGFAVAAPFEDRSLVRRNYTEEYADQLTDGTACRDVTVIYARGTDQQGNIGEPTDVGPEFLNDLGVYVGINDLAVAGVNYSASVEGFEEGGDPEGSQTMADLAALVCWVHRFTPRK